MIGGQSESKYEELTAIYKENKGINYKKVIPFAEDFLKIAKEEEDIFYQVKAYIMLGYLYDQENEYSKSVIYYLEGIRVSEKIDDERLIYAKIGMNKNLANILIEHKLFDLSYQFYNKAADIASKNNRAAESLEIKLNSLGFGKIESPEMIEVRMSILDSISKTNITDEYSLIRINNMLGIGYSSLGEKDKAAECYKKAISFNPINHPENYFYAAQNLTNYYIETGQFDEASKSLEITYNSLPLIKANYNEVYHAYLRTKAKLYDATNNPETESTYQLAVNILDTLSLDQKSLIVYKDFSNFYFNRKDFEKADYYSTRYSQQLEKYIERQAEINESDKKHHIAMLTQHYFDTIEASESRNSVIVSAQVGGLLLVLVFGGIILHLIYQRKKTNRMISKALLEIELQSEV